VTPQNEHREAGGRRARLLVRQVRHQVCCTSSVPPPRPYRPRIGPGRRCPIAGQIRPLSTDDGVQLGAQRQAKPQARREAERLPKLNPRSRFPSSAPRASCSPHPRSVEPRPASLRSAWPSYSGRPPRGVRRGSQPPGWCSSRAGGAGDRGVHKHCPIKHPHLHLPCHILCLKSSPQVAWPGISGHLRNIASRTKTHLTWTLVEPPVGIEPTTFSLREVRSLVRGCPNNALSRVFELSVTRVDPPVTPRWLPRWLPRLSTVDGRFISSSWPAGAPSSARTVPPRTHHRCGGTERRRWCRSLVGGGHRGCRRSSNG